MNMGTRGLLNKAVPQGMGFLRHGSIQKSRPKSFPARAGAEMDIYIFSQLQILMKLILCVDTLQHPAQNHYCFRPGRAFGWLE